MLAFWRLTPTKDRIDRARDASAKYVAVDRRRHGSTLLGEPTIHGGAPYLDRFLGTQDLYDAFECSAAS